MTAEEIQARLATLRAEQEKVKETLAQLQANVSAYQGAIEDCEYWLAQLKNE
jgi:chaperonin cofactor prefoldin